MRWRHAGRGVTIDPFTTNDITLTHFQTTTGPGGAEEGPSVVLTTAMEHFAAAEEVAVEPQASEADPARMAHPAPLIIELIGIGVATLVGFAFWQTRAAEPVMPLHIFRSRNFTLTSVIGFITGFVMFGAVLFLPLYQQSVQGASATNSGLLLLPMLGAVLAVSMVAGRLTTSSGNYKVFLIVGSVLMTVGLYLLARMDTGTTRFTCGAYMAVLGVGVGCLTQITMVVAQNSVEMKDMGVASSSATLFRTLGSSFGVAIMGALFNQRVQDVMTERAGALRSKVTEQSAQLNAAGLAKLPAAVREAYQHAVSAGTHSAFLLGSVAAVVAMVAAVFVQEVPLREAGPQTMAEDEAGGAASDVPPTQTGAEPV